MKRVRTLNPEDFLYDTDINPLQDFAVGLRPMIGAGTDLDGADPGIDGVLWIPPSGDLDAGVEFGIDDQHDWRDRLVWGWMLVIDEPDDRPGGVDDILCNGTSLPTQRQMIWGYTGTGAYADAGGTPVSTGNPPVRTAGSPNSYVISHSVAKPIHVYASPGGALCIYNDYAGGQLVILQLWASGQLRKRS